MTVVIKFDCGHFTPGATATSADQIVDVENVLVPWFAKYGVTTAVLRSDKYVAATNNTSLEMARIWK